MPVWVFVIATPIVFLLGIICILIWNKFAAVCGKCRTPLVEKCPDCHAQNIDIAGATAAWLNRERQATAGGQGAIG